MESDSKPDLSETNGWKKYASKSHPGRYYWFNKITGERIWAEESKSSKESIASSSCTKKVSSSKSNKGKSTSTAARSLKMITPYKSISNIPTTIPAPNQCTKYPRTPAQERLRRLQENLKKESNIIAKNASSSNESNLPTVAKTTINPQPSTQTNTKTNKQNMPRLETSSINAKMVRKRPAVSSTETVGKIAKMDESISKSKKVLPPTYSTSKKDSTQSTESNVAETVPKKITATTSNNIKPIIKIKTNSSKKSTAIQPSQNFAITSSTTSTSLSSKDSEEKQNLMTKSTASPKSGQALYKTSKVKFKKTPEKQAAPTTFFKKLAFTGKKSANDRLKQYRKELREEILKQQEDNLNSRFSSQTTYKTHPSISRLSSSANPPEFLSDRVQLNETFNGPPFIDTDVAMPLMNNNQTFNETRFDQEILNSSFSVPAQDENECEPMDWEPEKIEPTASNTISVASSSSTPTMGEYYNTVNENLLKMASEKYNYLSKVENNRFYFVIDTNVLLHCLTFVEDLRTSKFCGTDGTVIYIPYRVLQELDGLKTNKSREGAQVMAVRAIKYLNDKFENAKHMHVLAQSAREERVHLIDINCADDSIINCCLQLSEKVKKYLLLTEDVNLKNKALANGIPVSSKSDLLSKNIDISRFK